MRASFFKGKDHPLVIEETPKPQPVKDQVLVRLHAAALNHRDIWIRREQAVSGQGIERMEQGHQFGKIVFRI